MKKMLVLAALATTVIAAPAFAASSSTVVGGTVASVCTIAGPANNTGITLHNTTSIGDVVITCNDAEGFTAGASSLNGGKLVSTDPNNSTTFAYQLAVSGYGTATLTTNEQGILVSPGAQQYIDGFHVPVSIVAGAATGPEFAGNYRDTITWTIEGQ